MKNSSLDALKALHKRSQTVKRVRPFEPGFVLDNSYEIISMIGRGGMSTVYKARHLKMDRLVAIKLLNSQVTSGSETANRFKREAIAMSKLNHPNIVCVFGAGVWHAQPYLVMEYVRGTSLAEINSTEGVLTEARAMPIFAGIADALAHAHGQGVIHRDIKPSNIMITEAGGIKVVDFGLAKLVEGDKIDWQKLTKTDAVFGTVLYMSPEQCRGEAVGIESDVYSLGCLMYECMRGVPPFIGATPFGTMNKHLSDKAQRLDGIAPALSKLIECMMSKDPQGRPASADAIANALRNPSDAFHAARRQRSGRLFGDAVLHTGNLVSFSVMVLISVLLAAVAFASGPIERALFPQTKYMEPNLQGVLDHARVSSDWRYKNRIGKLLTETKCDFNTDVCLAGHYFLLKKEDGADSEFQDAMRVLDSLEAAIIQRRPDSRYWRASLLDERARICEIHERHSLAIAYADRLLQLCDSPTSGFDAYYRGLAHMHKSAVLEAVGKVDEAEREGFLALRALATGHWESREKFETARALTGLIRLKLQRGEEVPTDLLGKLESVLTNMEDGTAASQSRDVAHILQDFHQDAPSRTFYDLAIRIMPHDPVNYLARAQFLRAQHLNKLARADELEAARLDSTPTQPIRDLQENVLAAAKENSEVWYRRAQNLRRIALDKTEPSDNSPQVLRRAPGDPGRDGRFR